MNRVLQKRLAELEIEFFDTGVLRTEKMTNVPAISTFVPPNLETRLGSVPAVPKVLQSSSERDPRSDVFDRIGEAPVRRTLHHRWRLGPVNQAVEPPDQRRRQARSGRNDVLIEAPLCGRDPYRPPDVFIKKTSLPDKGISHRSY